MLWILLRSEDRMPERQPSLGCGPVRKHVWKDRATVYKTSQNRPPLWSSSAPTRMGKAPDTNFKICKIRRTILSPHTLMTSRLSFSFFFVLPRPVANRNLEVLEWTCRSFEEMANNIRPSIHGILMNIRQPATLANATPWINLAFRFRMACSSIELMTSPCFTPRCCGKNSVVEIPVHVQIGRRPTAHRWDQALASFSCTYFGERKKNTEIGGWQP